MKYRIEVLRMVANEVTVEASTPEAAVTEADRRDFPMPPVQDGQVLDGWEYVVYDKAGKELHRVEP